MQAHTQARLAAEFHTSILWKKIFSNGSQVRILGEASSCTIYTLIYITYEIINQLMFVKLLED